jgi:hypothetical protein
MNNNRLEKLIYRAGFSNTYERTRLERLVWLTASEIMPLLSEEQQIQIKDLLSIPDEFNKRINNNYLLKTKSEEAEKYIE